MTNPNFDADLTGSRVRLNETVVDVRFQRVKRHPTFFVLLFTGKLSSAQTTGAVDLDTVGTHIHSGLDGALHGTAETDTTLQLLSNALSHELRTSFGTAHFCDFDENFFIGGQFRNRCTQRIQLGTFFADQDTRAGGNDGDTHAIGKTLDLNTGNCRGGEFFLDEFTDFLVLMEPVTQTVLPAPKQGKPS